jgi:hypothetical protein
MCGKPRSVSREPESVTSEAVEPSTVVKSDKDASFELSLLMMAVDTGGYHDIVAPIANAKVSALPEADLTPQNILKALTDAVEEVGLEQEIKAALFQVTLSALLGGAVSSATFEGGRDDFLDLDPDSREFGPDSREF